MILTNLSIRNLINMIFQFKTTVFHRTSILLWRLKIKLVLVIFKQLPPKSLGDILKL